MQVEGFKVFDPAYPPPFTGEGTGLGSLYAARPSVSPAK